MNLFKDLKISTRVLFQRPLCYSCARGLYVQAHIVALLGVEMKLVTSSLLAETHETYCKYLSSTFSCTNRVVVL